jgi:hypothetical protein
MDVAVAGPAAPPKREAAAAVARAPVRGGTFMVHSRGNNIDPVTKALLRRAPYWVNEQDGDDKRGTGKRRGDSDGEADGLWAWHEGSVAYNATCIHSALVM